MHVYNRQGKFLANTAQAMLWKYKKNIINNNGIQVSIDDYDNYKPFLPLNETDTIIMEKSLVWKA
jgi:hypothetical protein